MHTLLVEYYHTALAKHPHQIAYPLCNAPSSLLPNVHAIVSKVVLRSRLLVANLLSHIVSNVLFSYAGMRAFTSVLIHLCKPRACQIVCEGGAGSKRACLYPTVSFSTVNTCMVFGAYNVTSLYPFGNGLSATMADFRGRTCRQLPRCVNPGQSQVISAPTTSNV